MLHNTYCHCELPYHLPIFWYMNKFNIPPSLYLFLIIYLSSLRLDFCVQCPRNVFISLVHCTGLI